VSTKRVVLTKPSAWDVARLRISVALDAADAAQWGALSDRFEASTRPPEIARLVIALAGVLDSALQTGVVAPGRRIGQAWGRLQSRPQDDRYPPALHDEVVGSLTTMDNALIATHLDIPTALQRILDEARYKPAPPVAALLRVHPAAVRRWRRGLRSRVNVNRLMTVAHIFTELNARRHDRADRWDWFHGPHERLGGKRSLDLMDNDLAMAKVWLLPLARGLGANCNPTALVGRRPSLEEAGERGSR
jgi:hypothetical protein